MGVDEEGTLERLKAHRRELIDPKIAEHRGRIVKTTGDGMLVEFASVVDAVRCAVEMQRGDARAQAGCRARTAASASASASISATSSSRAATFSATGSMSRHAWKRWPSPAGSASRGRRASISATSSPLAFEDLGEQSVKNIARPVRVYALRADTVTCSRHGR